MCAASNSITGKQSLKLSSFEENIFAAIMPTVMSAHERGEISRLLVAWNGGDEGALEELIPIVYPELRRIARIHLARRASKDTLESAALVNEAYLKLVRSNGVPCHN